LIAIRQATRALLAPLAIAALGPGAALPAAAADPPAAVRVDTGEIAGARFAIANPPGAWNRSVLLIAHGYRPESAPLVADLDPGRAFNRALLDEGWIVATTSYRRNGLIIGDAIADLDALRAHIAEAYGDPDRVILDGESIGGLVAAIMAERDPGPYQGAMVFDATLYAKEPDMRVGLSLLPRIPLLFVATLREAREARSYLTALVARPAPVVQPALFLISREGHTNISQAEHLAAFRALNDWIERGRDALPRPPRDAPYFDATVAPEPGPSTAVAHADGRGFDTRVAEVDPVYGNVLLEAQAPDFASAGIEPMMFFELRVGVRTYRTLYGRTYTDVRNDQWVAFPDADGRTVLSRNFANAAASAGLRVGETASVSAYGSQGPASR
jgi:pimeloyl-ACP methyl ester carboxylesterase